MIVCDHTDVEGVDAEGVVVDDESLPTCFPNVLAEWFIVNRRRSASRLDDSAPPSPNPCSLATIMARNVLQSFTKNERASERASE